MVLMCLTDTSADNGNTWYRTAKEVEQLYTKHYNRNIELPNKIYKSNGKYIGTINTSKFEVDPNFIRAIKDHLTDMIKKDWIKFIYWADLNHGHIFISEKRFESEYSKMLTNSMANKELDKDYYGALLKDRNLGILYHAAEHFAKCKENEKYLWTRNVVGWFNNKKPIELIKYDKDEKMFAGKGTPDGTRQMIYLYISAWKHGEFVIYPNGKEIRFDMSFEIEGVYDGLGKGPFKTAPDYN